MIPFDLAAAVIQFGSLRVNAIGVGALFDRRVGRALFQGRGRRMMRKLLQCWESIVSGSGVVIDHAAPHAVQLELADGFLQSAADLGTRAVWSKMLAAAVDAPGQTLSAYPAEPVDRLRKGDVPAAMEVFARMWKETPPVAEE